MVQILGKKLTAYVAGVKDTRVIDRWISGKVDEPYKEADQRIRLARPLRDLDGTAPVATWLQDLLLAST